MDLKITPSGQTTVKPTALGPGANTDTKLLIYGLFQKGRVLAQDGKNGTISPKIAPNCTLIACLALFLIVSSQESEAPLEPPDCDSRKDVPVDEHSLMRRKALCDNK